MQSWFLLQSDKANDKGQIIQLIYGTLIEKKRDVWQEYSRWIM